MITDRENRISSEKSSSILLRPVRFLPEITGNSFKGSAKISQR